MQGAANETKLKSNTDRNSALLNGPGNSSSRRRSGRTDGRTVTTPTGNSMKLIVQHHHVRSTDELDSLIEERILDLEPRLQIDEANVRLECRHHESPPFSVRIHLTTPGPDVVVESCDHTIRAAMDKAQTALERKIHGRARKRHTKVRSNLQAPALLRFPHVRR